MTNIKLTPQEIAFRDLEHAKDLMTRIAMARHAFDLKPAYVDSEVDFRFDAIKGMLDIAHADAFNMVTLWQKEYDEQKTKEHFRSLSRG